MAALWPQTVYGGLHGTTMYKDVFAFPFHCILIALQRSFERHHLIAFNRPTCIESYFLCMIDVEITGEMNDNVIPSNAGKRPTSCQFTKKFSIRGG